MKQFLLLAILTGSGFLFSCSSEDQLNEGILSGQYGSNGLKSELLETTTMAYNDNEIDALLADFFSGVSKKIVPPANLSAIFNAEFPNARDIEWEALGDIYCVEFEIGDVDHKIVYDAQGSVLLYVYDVRISALPKAVSDAALQKYPTYRIDDAERVLKGTVKAYLLELEKNGARDINVVFSQTGEFLYEQSYVFIPPAITNPNTDNNQGSGETIAPDGTYTNEQIINLVVAFERAKTKRATPPAVVAAAFQSQYTNVRDVEWETDNVIYNVEFEIGNVDYEAWYDANGVRLMHMEDIRTNALPSAVSSAIARDYQGFRIDDEPNKILINADVIYEISVEKGKTELDLYYLANGTFLKEIIDY